MKKLLFLTLSLLYSNIYANLTKSIVIDSTVVVDNNIIYTVIEDPQSFFITVETDDRKASKTILREGVTVYFDIKGKKKKKVFVRYPNKAPKSNGRRQQRGEENMEQEPNRDTGVENLPQEAFYNYFNTEREFHIILNDLDINIDLEILERNRIKYNLKIPKQKINDNPKKDLSKLSIGVLIGRDRSEEAGNERPGGGQSGMQMGGGMSGGGGRSGGGMSGGGGGGRQGGGGRSGGGNGGGQRPSQENNTQAKVFWIQTNPA